MNTTDERLTAPVPEACGICRNRERWIVQGIERNRCLSGHPMHEGCGWFVEATPTFAADRRAHD